MQTQKENNLQEVVEANNAALDQVLDLIRRAGEERYTQPAVDGGSPIGRHVRHILDHFNALRVGLDNGQINYDLRTRGQRSRGESRPGTAGTPGVDQMAGSNHRM